MKKVRKYWFITLAVLLTAGALLFYPQTGMTALSFSGRNFLNFLFMLTPIFICIGLMDVWIERDTMVKIMGEKAGFRGVIIALLLGMITAVPLYALLPVAALLLKKGGRIFNVLVFLCSSAAIRIPLLLFEISALGWQFTFTRCALNLGVVLAIAFIIDKLLSKTDKTAVYTNVQKL